MEAKFSLRQQSNLDPIIILQVFDSRFKDRRFMYTVGERIKKEDWKYEDKKNTTTGFPKDKATNVKLIDHLDKLATIVKNWGKEKIGSSSLVREELKKRLDSLAKDERMEQEQQIQKEEELFKLWKRIIDTTKNPKTGQPITRGTKRSKIQTMNLVTKYSIDRKKKLTFENMDMDFYHDLIDYMTTKGLDTNTQGRHIKEVKAVMREAAERDYKVNPSYQKKGFKVLRRETDAIYLNNDEIKLILDAKLSPAKQVLRDIFVMACFVGVRHSDWSQIRQSNIVKEGGKEFLKIKQTKTTDFIHVPVHPVVRMILNKYDGYTGKVISNQKFNQALKEICEKAFTDKKGKRIDACFRKATEVSTHTARRSFATNAYLSRSMNVYSIMQCTGHKTESSFLKYLKLSGLDKAQDIADSKFFNDDQWSSLRLAV